MQVAWRVLCAKLIGATSSEGSHSTQTSPVSVPTWSSGSAKRSKN